MSAIDKQCHRAIELIISDDWEGSHKIVQDINISNKSDLSLGKIVWHSGSPILTLYSIK